MSGYQKKSGWAEVVEMGEELAAQVAAANPTTRVRRGKVVEIPPEWRGEVTRPQTIRNRPSKLPRKERLLKAKHGTYGKKNGHPRNWAPRHTPGDVRDALGPDEAT